MNHPNPHDQPDEPTCDACNGTGCLSSARCDTCGGKGCESCFGDCVLCHGTGTLSQAAQRELEVADKDQRKIEERRGK